jgi:NAD-dependent deacetylase
MNKTMERAVEVLKKAKHVTAFTGAGISVESGIPPFRGEDGIWSKYDPQVLDLDYFHSHPLESWQVIKEIFYDYFGVAKPNAAHLAIAKLEEMGKVKAVITQNIDNLHQEAGSKLVHEFHGNSKHLICTHCFDHSVVDETIFAHLPPKCTKCGGLLKPDFIFFGEAIPSDAYAHSVEESRKADVFLLVGTTGEVIPASYIPQMAKRNGAIIIEVNTGASSHTYNITDIHLKGKATEVMTELLTKMNE